MKSTVNAGQRLRPQHSSSAERVAMPLLNLYRLKYQPECIPIIPPGEFIRSAIERKRQP